MHSAELDGDLPFLGKIKERRSLAPLRSSEGQPSNGSSLTRKSMPAITGSTSASLGSVYPPLPSFDNIPPVPPIPGAYVKATSVTFGTGNAGISNMAFSNTAQQLIADLHSKNPGFNSELLKGKQANLDKLVNVNRKVGEAGFGLGSSTNGNKVDRYAAAHDREFAR